LEGRRLLPVVTTFSSSKTTVRVRARVARAPGPFDAAAGSEVTAYEIHAGRTRVAPDAPRLFAVFERGGAPAVDADGVTSASGNVAGTYLHGLFANHALRGALLRHLAAHAGRPPDPRWRALRRGGPATLLLGGALTALGAAALAGLGGHVVGALAARLGALGALVEALALACLLSLRSLAAAALGVKTALAAGDLAAAR